MSFIISHYAIILAVLYAIVSEALAILQFLKYPTNSGVGGVLSAILKILVGSGAQPIPAASSAPQTPPST